MTGATPRAVLARLQHPGDTFGVSIAANGTAWDPSKPPGVDGMIFGRAVARYWLDAEGVVHLWYSPQEGPDRNVSGPRPELPRPSPAVRWILRGYLLVTTMTFGLTVWLVHAEFMLRLAAGMAAVMAVWVVVGRAFIVLSIFRGSSQPQVLASSPEEPMPAAVPDVAGGPSHSPTYQDLLKVNAVELHDLRQQLFKSVGVFVVGFVMFPFPWVFTGLLGLSFVIIGMVWFAVASHEMSTTRRSIERQLLAGSAKLAA